MAAPRRSERDVLAWIDASLDALGPDDDLEADETEPARAWWEPEPEVEPERWTFDPASLERDSADDDDDLAEEAPDVEPDASHDAGARTGVDGGGVVVAVARRRRAPRHTWVPEDLPPLVCPPGYVRDDAGRWRYSDAGDYVPGARDRTLRRAWRPPRCGCRRHVLFAEWAVRAHDELAWCAAVAEPCPTGWVSDAGTHVAALAVTVEDWHARADVALGIDAPELCVDQLLDPAAAAELVGLTVSSLSAYLARGRFCEPVGRLGRTPVWSRPVLARWAARRPAERRTG